MRRSRTIIWAALIALTALSCVRKPEVEEYKARWLRLRHTPIEEAKVGIDTLIEAEVEVSQDITDVRLFLYYRAGEEHHEGVAEMRLLDANRYFTSIPSQARGTLVEYYIEARAGTDLVVRVPAREKGAVFAFYYKGAPNRVLLISHIVLLFISLIILLLSGWLALRAIKDRRILLHIPRLAFLGAVVFFVSSFPISMIVAYQTYGRPWNGFPLGGDFTDNKSLAIVLYWAAATFFYRGSVLRKDPTTDLLSMRALPYVYLGGVITTIVLLAIPH